MATDYLFATPRLRLRPLRAADAGFIVALVNDDAWLRFIGDRNIHDEAAATAYIDKCHAMHERHGVGLLAVETAATGEVAGLCGLLRRDDAGDIDLGFAFLPAFRSRGFGEESAVAMLDFGHRVLGCSRILAYVHPDNERSIRLLTKLGFRYEAARRNGEGEVVTHVYGHAGGVSG